MPHVHVLVNCTRRGARHVTLQAYTQGGVSAALSTASFAPMLALRNATFPTVPVLAHGPTCHVPHR